jgi:hypothetical protein
MSSNTLELQQLESLFHFSIYFLNHCESRKKFTKITGNCSHTCGYTGPGIGIVLQIFLGYGIDDSEKLDLWLRSKEMSLETFMDIVNETIGNLCDLSDECPVIGERKGILGIITTAQSDALQMTSSSSDSMELQETPHRIYTGTDPDLYLDEGVNIISLFDKTTRQTFHHACLFINKIANMCFILDSWCTSDGQNSRPLSGRLFSFQEVSQAISRLNTDDVTIHESSSIVQRYFQPHDSFESYQIETLKSWGVTHAPFTVCKLDLPFVGSVFAQCEKQIREGKPSNFGGKKMKKSRKVKTSRKIKKSRKRCNKYRK